MGDVLDRGTERNTIQALVGRFRGHVNRMENSMKKIVSIAVLLAGAALLAGCPKKPNVVEPPTAGSQVSGPTSGEGASTSGNALGGDAASQGADVNGGANGVGPLAR